MTAFCCLDLTLPTGARVLVHASSGAARVQATPNGRRVMVYAEPDSQITLLGVPGDDAVSAEFLSAWWALHPALAPASGRVAADGGLLLDAGQPVIPEALLSDPALASYRTVVVEPVASLATTTAPVQGEDRDALAHPAATDVSTAALDVVPPPSPDVMVSRTVGLPHGAGLTVLRVAGAAPQITRTAADVGERVVIGARPESAWIEVRTGDPLRAPVTGWVAGAQTVAMSPDVVRAGVARLQGEGWPTSEIITDGRGEWRRTLAAHLAESAPTRQTLWDALDGGPLTPTFLMGQGGRLFVAIAEGLPLEPPPRVVASRTLATETPTALLLVAGPTAGATVYVPAGGEYLVGTPGTQPRGVAIDPAGFCRSLSSDSRRRVLQQGTTISVRTLRAPAVASATPAVTPVAHAVDADAVTPVPPTDAIAPEPVSAPVASLPVVPTTVVDVHSAPVAAEASDLPEHAVPAAVDDTPAAVSVADLLPPLAPVVPATAPDVLPPSQVDQDGPPAWDDAPPLDDHDGVHAMYDDAPPMDEEFVAPELMADDGPPSSEESPAPQPVFERVPQRAGSRRVADAISARSVYEGRISLATWAELGRGGQFWVTGVVAAAADSESHLESLDLLSATRLFAQGYFRGHMTAPQRALLQAALAGVLAPRLPDVTVFSWGRSEYFGRLTPQGIRLVNAFGRTEYNTTLRPLVAAHYVQSVGGAEADGLNVTFLRDLTASRETRRRFEASQRKLRESREAEQQQEMEQDFSAPRGRPRARRDVNIGAPFRGGRR